MPLVSPLPLIYVAPQCSLLRLFRAISRDPDVYPDPEAFKPSRWLNEKGQMREDLKFFNWGFGRRSVHTCICSA